MEFLSKAGLYFELLSQIVGTAAMIAAVTPTPKDDAFIGKVRQVIDMLGFNFGYARNRD